MVSPLTTMLAMLLVVVLSSEGFAQSPFWGLPPVDRSRIGELSASTLEPHTTLESPTQNRLKAEKSSRLCDSHVHDGTAPIPAKLLISNTFPDSAHTALQNKVQLSDKRNDDDCIINLLKAEEKNVNVSAGNMDKNAVINSTQDLIKHEAPSEFFRQSHDDMNSAQGSKQCIPLINADNVPQAGMQETTRPVDDDIYKDFDFARLRKTVEKPCPSQSLQRNVAFINPRAFSGCLNSLISDSSIDCHPNPPRVVRNSSYPPKSVGKSRMPADSDTTSLGSLLLTVDQGTQMSLLSIQEQTNFGEHVSSMTPECSSKPRLQLRYLGRTMPASILTLPAIKADDSNSLFRFEASLMNLLVENRFAALCAHLTAEALRQLSKTSCNESSVDLRDAINQHIFIFYPYISNEGYHFDVAMEAILFALQRDSNRVPYEQVESHFEGMLKKEIKLLQTRREEIEIQLKNCLSICITEVESQLCHLTQQQSIGLNLPLEHDSWLMKSITQTLDEQQSIVSNKMLNAFNSRLSQLKNLYFRDPLQRCEVDDISSDSQRAQIFFDSLLPCRRFDRDIVRMIDSIILETLAVTERLENSPGTIIQPLILLQSFEKEAIIPAVLESLTNATCAVSELTEQLVDSMDSVTRKFREYYSKDCPTVVLSRFRLASTFVEKIMEVAAIYITGSWRLTIEQALDQVLFVSGLESVPPDWLPVISAPFQWWYRSTEHLHFRKAISKRTRRDSADF